MIRRLWVDAEAAAYAGRALDFPGLRALLRVDREVRARGREPVVDTRYFATSLDPAAVPPARLLELVRGHWRVENALHYVKDRWWDEDRHVCRRSGLAVRFTMLMTAALSVLRTTLQPHGRAGMKAQADALSWEPSRAVAIITQAHR